MKKLALFNEPDHTELLLNIIITAVTISAFIFLCIYIIWARFLPAIIVHILYIIFHLLLFPLVKAKRYRFVKYGIVITFFIQLTLAAFFWFPPDTKYDLFYFIIPITSFTIMDLLNKSERHFSLIITVACQILYVISSYFKINFYIFEIDAAAVNILSAFSVITSIGTTFFIFFISSLALAKKSNELEYLANTDPLTQSANRRSFFYQGELEFELARKYGYSFSLIVMDIDHFKIINDTHGHDVGDTVLIDFSDTIRKKIRAEDIFGRHGGEEFGLILRNTTLETAGDIAEMIRMTVSEISFKADKKKFNITVSLGVIRFSENFRTFNEMMSKADIALYEAKNSGRNKVVIYN